MDNVKRLLKKSATAVDIIEFTLSVHDIANTAMAKGIEEEQIAIFLASYIANIVEKSENSELVAELAISEIRKYFPTTI